MDRSLPFHVRLLGRGERFSSDTLAFVYTFPPFKVVSGFSPAKSCPCRWAHLARPPTGRPLSTALWLASVAAAVLALAGPLWGLGETVTPTGGRNLVVAIDVSASMATSDEVPSRLGRAAAVVRRLAAGMPDTRMALVLFADRARLAVPLTMDREFLFGRLPASPYEVGDLPPGTRLRNLVDVMAAVVPDMDLESSAGLIISDGGFHDYSTVSAAHSGHSDITSH